MSEQVWEPITKREEGFWSKCIKRVWRKSDFKAGKDFTWNYWDEKDKMCKFFKCIRLNRFYYWDENIRGRSANTRCALRAYELYNLKAPTKSGKVLTREEDVANELVREGFMEYCTQQVVHGFRGTVQARLAMLKGLKYELYLKNRLENEVIVGLFDKEKIKEVIHLGDSPFCVGVGDTSYLLVQPDILVLYENGDTDIVACACYNNTGYSVPIRSRCAGGPEIKLFDKLHELHGRVKIKLSDDVILSKNKNTKVRLIFMFKSTHERTPYEAYKIYNKPEELPSHLSFSKKNIENGMLKIAKWVKTSKQASLKNYKLFCLP